MMLNLPNTLTIFRLLASLAVPLVFLFLPRPVSDWAALILFMGAAATDWFDGVLARRLNQISAFGTMLDPIADKVAVATALLVIVALHGLSPLVLIPATAILFRELFVSGLREFLGADAGKLKVTRVAKWKTTLQLIAVCLLLGLGIAEHAVIERIVGMDPGLVQSIMTGQTDDPVGLRRAHAIFRNLEWAGLAFLWLAMALTLFTGWDYFQKARPFLKETA